MYFIFLSLFSSPLYSIFPFQLFARSHYFSTQLNQTMCWLVFYFRCCHRQISFRMLIVLSHRHTHTHTYHMKSWIEATANSSSMRRRKKNFSFLLPMNGNSTTSFATIKWKANDSKENKSKASNEGNKKIKKKEKLFKTFFFLYRSLFWFISFGYRFAHKEFLIEWLVRGCSSFAFKRVDIPLQQQQKKKRQNKPVASISLSNSFNQLQNPCFFQLHLQRMENSLGIKCFYLHRNIVCYQNASRCKRNENWCDDKRIYWNYKTKRWMIKKQRHFQSTFSMEKHTHTHTQLRHNSLLLAFGVYVTKWGCCIPIQLTETLTAGILSISRKYRWWHALNFNSKTPLNIKSFCHLVEKATILMYVRIRSMGICISPYFTHSKSIHKINIL